MKDVETRIFRIKNENDFNEIALEIFRFQFDSNPVYRQYCELMHVHPVKVTSYSSIPFLPVELFKTSAVYCGNAAPEITFTSSGTTGQTTSRHLVKDVSLYEKSFQSSFRKFYGEPSDYCFLFLLPSYLERSGSSLVYMAEQLVKLSGNRNSAFYLHNLEDLKKKIEELKKTNENVFLFGVSYALLDLAESNIKLGDKFVVMETGGMKGKRREMVKEELHAVLKEKFSVDKIHSEYGMTELLSQAYSKGEGLFECPEWMNVTIRDPYDPFTMLGAGKSGGINVTDLANIHSCSFIATQDMGRVFEDRSFEVIGRFEDADLRGCNLMVE